MSAISQKTLKRRLESHLTRKNRVLVGYIETKHPETYKEACEYYEILNSMYPGKIDLRRTNEYAYMRNDIHMRKRYERKSQPKKMKLEDNMILTIPLIKVPPNNSCENTQLTEPENAQRTEPENTQPTEPENAQWTEPENTQPTEPENAQRTEPENTQPTEPENMPFPIITEKMMQDIINDLKDCDPQFEQWFEDLDLDIDIDIPDVSPLEAELV